jgi:NAD(P)H-dependent flavin oxidoreductase YrpB (nitropropane dioxygenase family)
VLQTAFTRLVGIEHPVVLAGMGSGIADGELAGRVSEAGGLGVVGASWLPAEAIDAAAARIREITDKPFGVNLLLWGNEELLDAALDVEPAVLSTAWPTVDQDLAAMFARAHDRGAKVMHMAARLDEAERAVAAGADVIVAQGSEGGGHVGEVAATVVVRQVVRAVAPVPVLAAGGFEDGAGLAAALALGADGVLLGTRFLAADEAPLPDWLKQEIVASDGYDTVVTTMPDALSGRDWPGAWARVLRTPFIERWMGRDPEVQRRRGELRAVYEGLRAEEKPDDWFLWVGQSAGLIDSVEPAGDIVRRIVAEAEEVLRSRLPELLA